MARESIPLPRFGEGVNTAELIEWLVAEGTTVARGDDVAEVQTAKAVLTVAAPNDGVLAEHSIQVGDEVEVGDVIGWLEVEGSSSAGADDRPTPAGAPSPAVITSAPSAPHPSPRPTAGVPAASALAPVGPHFRSPRVRARMEELELTAADLEAIPGSGRGGRVTADDLDAWMTNLDQFEEVKTSPMRLAVADSMRRSWARPLATVARKFSLDALLDHRRTVEGRPSLTLYSARALAVALARDYTCARRLVGHKLFAPKHYNIAIAAEAEDGILMPVQLDADRTPLAEMTAHHNQSLKDGPHTRGEVAIATVTNYGSLNLTWATPIAPPEQSCILGVGKPEIVPVWDPGEKNWGRGKACELTLTFDHRVADGAAAASLLHAIAKLLEAPQDLE